MQKLRRGEMRGRDQTVGQIDIGSRQRARCKGLFAKGLGNGRAPGFVGVTQDLDDPRAQIRPVAVLGQGRDLLADRAGIKDLAGIADQRSRQGR